MKYIVLIGLIIMTFNIPKTLRRILMSSSLLKRKLRGELTDFASKDTELLFPVVLVLSIFLAVVNLVFFGVSAVYVGGLAFATLSVVMVITRLGSLKKVLVWSVEPEERTAKLVNQVSSVYGKIFDVAQLVYLAYLWGFLINNW